MWVAQESDDDLLSAEQAARLAGVSRWTLRRAAQAGLIRSQVTGSGGSREPNRRYRRGDVKAYRVSIEMPNVLDELKDLRTGQDEIRARLERLEQRGQSGPEDL